MFNPPPEAEMGSNRQLPMSAIISSDVTVVVPMIVYRLLRIIIIISTSFNIVAQTPQPPCLISCLLDI